MPSAGEVPILGSCSCKASDQLTAYVARLYDPVDDQLARKPQNVDVDLVLFPKPLYVGRPLSHVIDLSDLVSAATKVAYLDQ